MSTITPVYSADELRQLSAAFVAGNPNAISEALDEEAAKTRRGDVKVMIHAIQETFRDRDAFHRAVQKSLKRVYVANLPAYLYQDSEWHTRPVNAATMAEVNRQLPPGYALEFESFISHEENRHPRRMRVAIVWK